MSKMKSFRTLAILYMLLVAVTACDPNENETPTLEADLISTAEIQGYTVELLADAALSTGYNQLYWRISKDNTPIEVQNFTATPIMHMTMMSHSCPYTQPESMIDIDQVHQSTAHFIMASGEMGYWEYQISFRTQHDQVVEGKLDIEVASSWRLNSTQGKDGARYYFSWVSPETPKTGNQEWSIAVHKRESMMSFPAITDAELTVYPYMDMGGGQGHSTSFESPTHTQKGHYTGTINYSMSGVWTTQVSLTVPNDTSGVVTFEYEVRGQ